MSQSKKRRRSRNYCFTDFQLLDFEKIYKENQTIIRYICFGREKCPKTKKEHIQGWVQLYNPKSLQTVKRIVNCNKIHVEICKGNEKFNDTYCKKDNDFKTFGTCKRQGQRTDLEDIKMSIEKGDHLIDIWDSHFSTMLRYHNGVNKYRECYLKTKTKKFRKLNVSVYYGATGSGKTRTAVEKNPNAYKIQGSALKWWDGYEGEKTLIIDEYNNDVEITKLLSLLDGYQLRLAIKGGFTYANWNKVIITTNLTINELHANAKPLHRCALSRRINEFTKTARSE